MIPNPSNNLLLVVGMHRSGTSLLGSILNALNVPTPGPLIAADVHNPEGYFERKDITSLQEELLIDLGRWWPSREGLEPLPRDWRTSPRGQRAALSLKRLLQIDQETQRGPWAIKDPRSSLLLPLWRQVSKELGINLYLLLAIREPAEVVVSLVGRDHAPAGMDVNRAAALWMHHHKQLLEDGYDLPLHVIDYSSWFTNGWNQMKALAKYCHGQEVSDSIIQKAMCCIKPQHRRSKTQISMVKLDRNIQQLYKHLQHTSYNQDKHILLKWSRHQKNKRTSHFQQHPWQAALRALGATGSQDLKSWLDAGIPEKSLKDLQGLNQSGFPGEDPSAFDGPMLPPSLNLELIGTNLNQWQCHLWIDQLPLADNTQLIDAKNEDPDATLHVQPLSITAKNPSLLMRLNTRKRVFDPNPVQVRLLRLLGVNAEPLALHFKGKWLNNSFNSQATAETLGLPNPYAIKKLTLISLCLGSSQEPSWLLPPEGVLQLPLFPPSPSLTQTQAQALAGWIESCRQTKISLVRLNPEPEERNLWNHLQVPCFVDQISPQELLNELQEHESDHYSPAEIQTPSPINELLWEHTTDQKARAAICISSFNYANRLHLALTSCANQTLADIELIIVDDASNDDSIEVIQTWLNKHGRRFCRVQLLRHKTNGGLASARNSGFAAAQAPWCWVLDADNQIDAKAIEHCLIIAEAASENTAVVHPLIRKLNDQNQPMGLVGFGHAWQKEQMRSGNVIDAMALIRRSAWLTVNGYSHIPGGWEDFDFWCKLIDANLHGVLCPQVLATYRLHGNSMLQSQTNHQQRRLSRLLQTRHPWLQLPYANLDLKF